MTRTAGRVAAIARRLRFGGIPHREACSGIGQPRLVRFELRGERDQRHYLYPARSFATIVGLGRCIPSTRMSPTRRLELQRTPLPPQHCAQSRAADRRSIGIAVLACLDFGQKRLNREAWKLYSAAGIYPGGT